MSYSSLVPDNILKTFILLFGFNIEIQNKIKRPLSKENISETFYLINAEWIEKFKEYNDYQTLSSILSENNSFSYNTYNDYENNIDKILNCIRGKISQKDNNFQIELKEKISFDPLQNKVSENYPLYYFNEFYIINEKIYQELSNYMNVKSNFRFNFYIGEYCIFFNGKNFEIGNINDKGVFFPHYHILIVDNYIQPLKEIEIILVNNIDKYFFFRKIKKDDRNIQNLLLENKQIGYFINVLEYKKQLYKILMKNNNNSYNLNEEVTTKIIEDFSETKIKLEQEFYSKQKNKTTIKKKSNIQNNNQIAINNFNARNNFKELDLKNQFSCGNIQNHSRNNIDNFNQIQNNNYFYNNQQQINFNPLNNFNPQNPQIMQNYNNFAHIQQNYNFNNNNMMNNNFALSQQNFLMNNMNQMIPQNNANFNQINNPNNLSLNEQMNQNNPQQKKNDEIPDNANITSLKQLKNIPMIGLNNIGQTCYMNSVLQCFSNLYHLTNYFLDPKKQDLIKNNNIKMNNPDDPNAPSLAIAYQELIEKLWKGKPKVPYSPKNFKDILGKLNSLFKEENAGDSKDLACFIIMQLHTELNHIDSNVNKTDIKIVQPDDVIVDPYNLPQVQQYFFNDYKINNDSIITKYFYGTNQNMFECQVCKMNNIQKGIMNPLIKYNFENFFYLEFPLEEVRKNAMVMNNNIGMNMGMNFQNINQVSLYDCFNYYQKQNEMDGYCEKCGSNNAKIYTVTKIFSPPNILMIVFNRGKGLQFNIKINFEENINLTQFLLNNNNNNTIYELQSIIKHLGDNSASGHFIAYCRSPIPNSHNDWFCYNDKTVIQTTNWNDILNIGVTYILFYQLKNK